MTVNPKMRTTTRSRMKSLLSRTSEITDSKAGIWINHKDQANAAIDTTPEAETTGTGTGSAAYNAKSRITLRKNAGRELKTINHAKTNKDEPTGLKCMWQKRVKKEINRDSSRFFIKESDDTPHPGSQRHSTVNSQFMYNFHRYLQ